ncbi:hypothetical protein HPB48_007526 [Haemaphysalis longicornis]|uniref:Uncharacterized protein n=1 Tax=Haemaphysalis longicornis TaxID=44386 RepID=A0A9J6GW68_HAELO|nr:hypothetical protein HPB48_007526 [Haemaphysalis longicornis]
MQIPLLETADLNLETAIRTVRAIEAGLQDSRTLSAQPTPQSVPAYFRVETAKVSAKIAQWGTLNAGVSAAVVPIKCTCACT